MNFQNEKELAKAKILELVKNGSMYEERGLSDEQIIKKIVESAKEYKDDDNFDIWLMCSLKEGYFFDEESDNDFSWKEDSSMELEDCISFYEENGKNWDKAIEQIEEEYGFDECNQEEFYFSNAEMKLVCKYIKEQF